MRSRRLLLLLLAVYLLFIGGGTYYALIFPIRVFHQVAITVLLALWLFTRLRKGSGLPATPLNLPLLAACGVWLVSALFSVDPRMAFEHLWLPFTHLLMFYVVVELIQHGQQRLVMETQFMLAALVALVAGMQFVSWYLGLGITPDTTVGWVDVIGPGTWLPLNTVRLWLPLGVSTWLAAYVAPLMVLVAAWALTARRDYRIALWLLAGLLLFVLVLTFSRGGYFSAAAGIAVFIMLLITQRYQGALRRLLSGRGMIVLVGGAAAIGVVAAIVLVMSRDGSRIAGDALRVGLWRGATGIVSDYPVLGVGPGLFGRVYRDYRDPAYVDDRLGTAHNAYLNSTAETGLVGLAVTLWLGITIAWTWWKLYREEKNPGRKLRLGAVFAGLAGMAVQNLFDTFTLTPMVLLCAVLVAYCTVDPTARMRMPFASISPWRRTGAAAALISLIGFGIFWIPVDAAHSQHRASLNPDLPLAAALEDSLNAQSLDPSFPLYRLQEAYLKGQQAYQGEVPLQQGIEAYQEALTLAPTWDTGWINLAALAERDGNTELALQSLTEAREINALNVSRTHWARLAEASGGADEADIVNEYLSGMLSDPVNLPLSAFWWETPLRRQALEAYAELITVDLQYRLWAVHDPERLAVLIPGNPVTAEEWWVVGEHLLTSGDAEGAEGAFTQAIVLSPRTGDFYASRARATFSARPEDALRDLNIAQLLGTRTEFPNAIHAWFADDAEIRRTLLVDSLPPRAVDQNFEAVSYSRVASFDIFPEMRRPGPGTRALQPWYTLAEEDIARGNNVNALTVYRAILDYAPDEQPARVSLAALEAQLGIESGPSD